MKPTFLPFHRAATSVAVGEALATLACGAAGLGLLWTLASLGWRLADLPQAVAPLAPDRVVQQHVAQINGPHPFGLAAARGGTAASEADAADPSAGRWHLLATLAAGSGAGTAMLDRAGGEVRIVRQGEWLSPGRRVARILPSGIEIEGPGGTQRIDLQDFLPFWGASPPQGEGAGRLEPALPGRDSSPSVRGSPAEDGRLPGAAPDRTVPARLALPAASPSR